MNNDNNGNNNDNNNDNTRPFFILCLIALAAGLFTRSINRW